MKFFQSNTCIAFIDAYHAPFVFKHRYWIGVLLFTRIIHHGLSSILDESIHPLVVSCLVSALLILRHVICKVYKHWWVGFLETAYLINHLVFSVSTYYVRISNSDQVALANTSVSIAFILFLWIVLYHTYTSILKKTRLTQKVIPITERFLHLSKRTQNKSEVNEVCSKPESSSSRLQMQALREPFLDDTAPLTPLKDSPSAPPPPRPVTTTVVCIEDVIQEV